MTKVKPKMRQVSVDGAVIDMRLKLSQLPLREWNFANCPAIPFWADQYGDPDLGHVFKILKELETRADEREPALQGLSTEYTIAGRKAPARDFLFGGQSSLGQVIAEATSSCPRRVHRRRPPLPRSKQTTCAQRRTRTCPR